MTGLERIWDAVMLFSALGDNLKSDFFSISEKMEVIFVYNVFVLLCGFVLS